MIYICLKPISGMHDGKTAAKGCAERMLEVLKALQKRKYHGKGRPSRGCTIDR